MVGWRALLDGAQPLELSAPPLDFSDRSVHRLGSVKIRGTGFRYPRSSDSFDRLKKTLETVVGHDAGDAQVLAELLRSPLRAYPLEGDHTRIALVGAYRIDARVEPRTALLIARTGESRMDLDLEPDAFPVGGTAEEIAFGLESIYLLADLGALRPEPTRGANDAALWVGGSAEEAEDPGWRKRISACLGAHGLGVTVRERPALDIASVKRAINEFRGSALVCWIPRMGNATLATELAEQFSPKRVVALAEYGFEDALEELRITLSEEPVEEAATTQREATAYEAGETYFFKKIAARGGGGDRMISRRDSCGHNAWSPSHKAPQAIKGIETLTGRKVRTLEHCGSCTGGGMWRAVLN